MAMKIYTPTDHARAFQLWIQMSSFRAVARRLETTHPTIMAWAGEFPACACMWHRWSDHRARLIAALTATPPPVTDLPVSPSLPRKLVTDLPNLPSPPPAPAPTIAANLPLRSETTPARRLQLEQEWSLLVGLRLQAAMYMKGQIITDSEGRQHVIPAVPPRTFGELVKAIKDIHEEMRTFLGILPPMQRVGLTGPDGGPVQFEDVSRPVDERRARIRGMLLAIKGRTDSLTEDSDGSGNGQRQSA